MSNKTAWKVVFWNFAALVIVAGLVFGAMLRRAHRFDALILSVAREYRVDPRLVAAVTWQESRFDPAAIGTKGEVGLMQVTETAGGEWAAAESVPLFTRSDLFDPMINVRAGTWYLARGMEYWSDYYKDPIPFALAEYNAGRSRVEAWTKSGKVREDAFMDAVEIDSTREYITRILDRYRGGI